MTLDDFFEATGIKFIDDITCMRYSTAMAMRNMPVDNGASSSGWAGGRADAARRGARV